MTIRPSEGENAPYRRFPEAVVMLLLRRVQVVPLLLTRRSFRFGAEDDGVTANINSLPEMVVSTKFPNALKPGCVAVVQFRPSVEVVMVVVFDKIKRLNADDQRIAVYAVADAGKLNAGFQTTPS